MNGREERASFAHEGVRISVLLPATWSVTETASQHVRFFGPAHPDHDNYRATFSICLGEPDGFEPEGFQDFCDASITTLERSTPEFEIREITRFALSSFVDMHAVWYTGRRESGLAFAQLQALGLMDRYNLYLINAACLLPLAELYVPLFDDILRSLRMLPAVR